MNPERYLHNKVPQLDQSEEVKTSIDKENRLRKAKSDKQEDLNIEERDSLKAVQNNPEARIEVYMKRLENIFLNKDKSTRDRNLQLLRPHILDAFIIKPEQVPESYFELQKRIARERGQAIDEIPTSVREQMIKTIIEEQTASLDNWMNYLTSSDAVYPTWFKYFAFRNITKLSQFDKERGEYKKRTDSTVAPFPDIYRESLAIVCDELESAIKSADKSNSETRATLDAKFPNLYATETNRSLELSLENRENIEGEWITYHQESTNSHHNNNEDNEDNEGGYWDNNGDWMENDPVNIEPPLNHDDETLEDIQKFSSNKPEDNNIENYGYFDEKEFVAFHKPLNGAREDGLDNFGYFDEAGLFVKYDIPTNKLKGPVQKSQADLLYESLQNKGTGWCTAGHSTAEHQLQNGDFHVYYSYDASGNPTIPRIAIRMEGNSIGEVRGILPHQELEPVLADILDTKLGEFGGEADSYRKKSADMKRLTEIDKKTQSGEVLSRHDLRFLYEMDSKIEGFGYKIDPRISEIIARRSWNDDMRVIYEAYDDNDLFNKLTEAGKEEDIYLNISSFKELNAENVKKGTILSLVARRDDYFNVGFLNDLTGPESDYFAQKLIESDQIWKFGNSLKHFKGLSIKIAQLLIEVGGVNAVADNARSFDEVNHNQIVQKLIEAGHVNSIAGDLYTKAYFRFKGLDSNTANMVIEAGRVDAVADNLSRFKNIGIDTINLLIENGITKPIDVNLRSSEVLDSNAAKKLIEAGQSIVLLRNLTRFQELDSNIATQLISPNHYHRGDDDLVIRNFSRFKEIDYNKVAERLIKAGSIETLIENFPSFKDLSEEILAKIEEYHPGTVLS